MKDNEIRRALDTIITRDRINIELFKMISDSNAAIAFQHIFDSNLYIPVFCRLDFPPHTNLAGRIPCFRIVNIAAMARYVAAGLSTSRLPPHR